MTVAVGLELSAADDMVSIAVAGAGSGRWAVDLAFYGSPGAAVAEAERLALDSCGLFLDSVVSAGLLDALRSAAVWLHELGPEDVSAADYQFTEAVKGQRVKLGDHPALRASMMAALPRSSARWGFERRKVTADAGPVNACAFALLGAQRHEAAQSPGVWVV